MVQISDKNYDQRTIVKSEKVEFSTLMKVNIHLEIFILLNYYYY